MEWLSKEKSLIEARICEIISKIHRWNSRKFYYALKALDRSEMAHPSKSAMKARPEMVLKFARNVMQFEMLRTEEILGRVFVFKKFLRVLTSAINWKFRVGWGMESEAMIGIIRDDLEQSLERSRQVIIEEKEEMLSIYPRLLMESLLECADRSLDQYLDREALNNPTSASIVIEKSTGSVIGHKISSRSFQSRYTYHREMQVPKSIIMEYQIKMNDLTGTKAKITKKHISSFKRTMFSALPPAFPEDLQEHDPLGDLIVEKPVDWALLSWLKGETVISLLSRVKERS